MTTLLEMVQGTLGEMISDEIASIDDTDESRTVARIYQRVYYDLAVRMEFSEHEGIFNLDETSAATPILMTRPDNIRLIEWVRYEKSTLENDNITYHPITFVPVKDFLDITFGLLEEDDNVDVLEYTVDSQTFNLLYRNDRHPCIYTSFDDETLVFDSFNSDVDAFLQSTKTIAYGKKFTTFTLSDSFVPDIEEQHIPLLIGEATKRAYELLKDRIPMTVDRTARQLKISSQKNKPAVEYGHPENNFPNYGR